MSTFESNERKEVGKLPYQAPKLVRAGKLADITAGGAGSKADESQAAKSHPVLPV